jgi:serine/threonine protein kinase
MIAQVLQGDYHLPADSPETQTLDRIVQRCVARDARDRYGSANELARDLIPALAACRTEWPPASEATGDTMTA